VFFGYHVDVDFITIIGFTAATLTTLAGVPQFIKTVRTKETKGLSLWTYIILAVGISLWLIYGILKQDMPLIFSNVVVIFPTIVILLTKLKHG